MKHKPPNILSAPLVFLLCLAFAGWLGNISVTAGLVAFSLFLLSGVVWVGYKLFVKPQSRISEWLAATMLTGAAMLAVRLLIEFFAEPIDTRIKDTIRLFMVGTPLIMLFSSGVGWRVASQRSDKTSRERFGTLAAFWSAGAGACIFLAGVVVLVSIKAVGNQTSDGRWPGFIAMLTGVAMCLPAGQIARSGKRVPEPEMPPNTDQPEGAGPTEPQIVIVTQPQPPNSPLLLLLFPIILPLAIWSLRKPQRFQRRNLQPANENDIPIGTRVHLLSFDDEISRHGYEPLGFCMQNYFENQTHYSRVWQHPQLGMATVEETITPAQIQRRDNVTLIAFYQDNSTIETNSTPETTLTVDFEGSHWLSIPGEPSIRRLVEVHRAA